MILDVQLIYINKGKAAYNKFRSVQEKMKEYIDYILYNYSLYNFFNTTATAVLVIYNMSMFREKRNILSRPSKYLRETYYPKSKSKVLQFFQKIEIELFIEIFIISMIQYLPSSLLNPWYGKVGGTGANYFGVILFAPLMVVAFCICVGIDPLKQLDLIAPAYPLALTFVKIGCFFGECCRGMEWKDLLGKDIEGNFPIQLLEAALALLIFFILRFWREKAKIGTLFPMYLILYSGIRFFSEFLRIEDNVFGALKTYHMHCMIGICVGVFELFLVWMVRTGMEYRATEKRKKTKKHSKR